MREIEDIEQRDASGERAGGEQFARASRTLQSALAVVVGSYRWSAGSENEIATDAPDAMNPRTRRWWVPALTGMALIFAAVSLANPIAMGFAYGGLNAPWEPAIPDLIDRLILQTGLLVLIPLVGILLGLTAIIVLGRVRPRAAGAQRHRPERAGERRAGLADDLG